MTLVPRWESHKYKVLRSFSFIHVQFNWIFLTVFLSFLFLLWLNAFLSFHFLLAYHKWKYWRKIIKIKIKKFWEIFQTEKLWNCLNSNKSLYGCGVIRFVRFMLHKIFWKNIYQTNVYFLDYVFLFMFIWKIPPWTTEKKHVPNNFNSIFFI